MEASSVSFDVLLGAPTEYKGRIMSPEAECSYCSQTHEVNVDCFAYHFQKKTNAAILILDSSPDFVKRSHLEAELIIAMNALSGLGIND
jgi:hypothetical protein